MNNIGFIGMGNMAQAIASGLIENSIFDAKQIFAYAPHFDKLSDNASRIGFMPLKSASEVVQKCDTIIMACKPYQIDCVLDEIAVNLSGKNLISIALGWNFEKYTAAFTDRNIDSSTISIQFIMPNTPAQVGEGVFLFEKTNSLSAKDRMCLMDAFGKLGMVTQLPDNLMGIGGAVTGCGPAFIDLFIEAMGDAAVKYGIPRTQAYELVSQTMKGSAKLQLESGLHPGVLKDAVCSPGGSTICGVAALEEAGFRAACISAIDAIMNR